MPLGPVKIMLCVYSVAQEDPLNCAEVIWCGRRTATLRTLAVLLYNGLRVVSSIAFKGLPTPRAKTLEIQKHRTYRTNRLRCVAVGRVLCVQNTPTGRFNKFHTKAGYLREVTVSTLLWFESNSCPQSKLLQELTIPTLLYLCLLLGSMRLFFVSRRQSK